MIERSGVRASMPLNPSGSVYPQAVGACAIDWRSVNASRGDSVQFELKQTRPDALDADLGNYPVAPNPLMWRVLSTSGAER